MSLDPAAVQIANERLWAAHPELAGRQLTADPADAALRQEWRNHYNAAVAAAVPPPPAVVPAPAAPPPAVAPVAACPPAPPPVTVTKCDQVKGHVREGDIVLRGERGNEESEFIGKVSGCDYSHAGIVARNAKGELVVVDAYPGRSSGAVAEQSVDDFFCGHGATHGAVTRPKDCAAADKAARWAMDQTSDPDYEFDLWDPWNNDPKRLYCADFVHQSFQNAGVDLVPAKTDLLDAAHRDTTIAEARRMAANDSKLAKLASDDRIEQELRNRTGGSSEYITPCDVAKNAGTDPVVVYDSGVGRGAGGGKKN